MISKYVIFNMIISIAIISMFSCFSCAEVLEEKTTTKFLLKPKVNFKRSIDGDDSPIFEDKFFESVPVKLSPNKVEVSNNNSQLEAKLKRISDIQKKIRLLKLHTSATSIPDKPAYSDSNVIKDFEPKSSTTNDHFKYPKFKINQPWYSKYLNLSEYLVNLNRKLELLGHQSQSPQSLTIGNLIAAPVTSKYEEIYKLTPFGVRKDLVYSENDDKFPSDLEHGENHSEKGGYAFPLKSNNYRDINPFDKRNIKKKERQFPDEYVLPPPTASWEKPEKVVLNNLAKFLHVANISNLIEDKKRVEDLQSYIKAELEITRMVSSSTVHPTTPIVSHSTDRSVFMTKSTSSSISTSVLPTESDIEKMMSSTPNYDDTYENYVQDADNLNLVVNKHSGRSIKDKKLVEIFKKTGEHNMDYIEDGLSEYILPEEEAYASVATSLTVNFFIYIILLLIQ